MKKIWFLFIIAFVIAGPSCTDFEEDVPVTLELNRGGVVLTPNTEFFNLTVKSGLQWSIESMPDWVKVDYIDRSSSFAWDISFTARANDEFDREGVIVIKAGSETANLALKQSGRRGQYVPVESVTLEPTDLALSIGNSAQLEFEVLPQNASMKSVLWESDSPAIATVDDSGRVSAVAKGTTNITVKTEDGGKTAYCIVTVVVPVESVRLDKSFLSMDIGEKQTLIATVLPDDALDKSVTWSSSNTRVATVSSSGQVTAVSPGTTTIKVTTTDGGKTASCAVTVKSILVTGVSLDKTSIEMFDGTSTTLNATVYPSNATTKTVRWTSSDSNVATVQDGRVTACNPGTCTITVTTDDGGYSASCSVLVKIDTSPSVWDGSTVSYDWYSRATNGVYHIKNAAELAGLSKSFSQGYYKYGNFSGCTFYLDRDIDLNNKEWTPIGIVIGNTYYSFAACFDGNGHVIKGLKVTRSLDSTAFQLGGLFGCAFTEGFSVKNLTVKGAISIDAPSSLVGMFSVGGIVGYVNCKGSISNCHSEVTINASATTGNYISIYAGGIAGGVVSNSVCPIDGCSSKGSISVTLNSTNKARIGGIVGQYNVSSDVISRCSSSSTITVSSGKTIDVGGIAGTTTGCNEVNNSIFSGRIDVYNSSYAFVAGIVADPFSTISAKNCLMVGSYSKSGGTAYLSAIFGVNSSGNSASNTYYLNSLSSSTTYGTSITSDKLKSGSPLQGFDTSIWAFPSGSYPYLIFE